MNNFDQGRMAGVLGSLLKRECQEHRGTFLYVPLGITAFLLTVMMFVSLSIHFGEDTVRINVSSQSGDGVEMTERSVVIGNYWGERLHRLAAMSPDMREAELTRVYLAASSPLFIALWFVVAFYLLGTLYDDRKDRSILFWKSMPVADAMTITSKLLAGLIVAPLIYFLSSAFLHIAMLVIASLSALSWDIDVYETLWQSANVFGNWLTVIGFHLMSVLWCLPLYAWLLFTSAWARSVPLAIALAGPIAVGFIDSFFIPGNVIGRWIVAHIAPLGYEDERGRDLTDALDRMISLEMVISLAIAAVFIGGAVYFRRRADEI